MRYVDLYYNNRNITSEIIVPKSIITWILNHICSPIQGYEHKTDQYGKGMSYREQVSETQYQLFIIATDYYKRGASEEKILDVLSNFRKNNCE